MSHLDDKVDLKAGNERSMPTFVHIVFWLMIFGLVIAGISQGVQLVRDHRRGIPNKPNETLNTTSN